MSSQRISKDYTFEASHYLPNHPGKCKRLHGHSYRVTVQVEGEVEDVNQAGRGMVIDYAELDTIAKPIINLMDHTHLYWDEEHDIILKAVESVEPKSFVDSFTYIGARTTAENIAKFIFQNVFTYDVCGRFPSLTWARVTVHETAKTSASYEGPTTMELRQVGGF